MAKIVTGADRDRVTVNTNNVWERIVGIENSLDNVETNYTPRLTNVESQLAQNVTDLRSRSINALSPPSPFQGVKVDGTDDSARINILLQNFDVVFLPPKKTYGISSTIIVPDGKTLISENGMATLNLLVPNIPAVELNHLSKVDNISVNLAAGNTLDTGCGFRLRTSPLSARQYIGKVEIIGTDSTGNGIYVSETANYIAFSVIENLYCFRVKNGFKVDVTAPAYANSFIVNNFVTRASVRGIWLKGSDGNVFNNIEWNTGTNTVEVIYCNSNSNQFNGFFYDLYLPTYTDLLATFDTTASNNIIRSANHEEQWRIVDNNQYKMNYLNTNKNDVMNTVNLASYMPHHWVRFDEYRLWGDWYKYKPYGGIQDNALAFVDKHGAIRNVGKTISSGTLANIFNPFAMTSTGKPTWNLLDGENVVIEIDTLQPNHTTKRMDFLQVVFSISYIPKYVKLEAFNGASWVTLKEETNNNKRYVVFHDTTNAPIIGGDVQSIRVTLSQPLHTSKDVRVESINGRMLGSPGFSFMPRNGGMIYGNLDMNNNYLTVGKVNSLPTASVTYRGQIIRIEGSTGIEDKTYVCKKKADDTYSWVQIDL